MAGDRATKTQYANEALDSAWKADNEVKRGRDYTTYPFGKDEQDVRNKLLNMAEEDGEMYRERAKRNLDSVGNNPGPSMTDARRKEINGN